VSRARCERVRVSAGRGARRWHRVNKEEMCVVGLEGDPGRGARGAPRLAGRRERMVAEHAPDAFSELLVLVHDSPRR
jgi:hypothetical protein